MRTATQTFIQSPGVPQVALPTTIDEQVSPSHADELCDELMLHTFECEDCINGREELCPMFCSLRFEIEQAGGPTRGVGLAM